MAQIAKLFGSATSSVLIPRLTLCLNTSFGTTIQAVCIPAILKALVGAIHIIVFSKFVFETEAKGIYSF